MTRWQRGRKKEEHTFPTSCRQKRPDVTLEERRKKREIQRE